MCCCFRRMEKLRFIGITPQSNFAIQIKKGPYLKVPFLFALLADQLYSKLAVRHALNTVRYQLVMLMFVLLGIGIFSFIFFNGNGCFYFPGLPEGQCQR